MIIVPTSQALAANFAPVDMRGRYMAVYGLSCGHPLHDWTRPGRTDPGQFQPEPALVCGWRSSVSFLRWAFMPCISGLGRRNVFIDRNKQEKLPRESRAMSELTWDTLYTDHADVYEVLVSHEVEGMQPAGRRRPAAHLAARSRSQTRLPPSRPGAGWLEWPAAGCPGSLRARPGPRRHRHGRCRGCPR